MPWRYNCSLFQGGKASARLSAALGGKCVDGQQWSLSLDDFLSQCRVLQLLGSNEISRSDYSCCSDTCPPISRQTAKDWLNQGTTALCSWEEGREVIGWREITANHNQGRCLLVAHLLSTFQRGGNPLNDSWQYNPIVPPVWDLMVQLSMGWGTWCSSLQHQPTLPTQALLAQRPDTSQTWLKNSSTCQTYEVWSSCSRSASIQ